ncbi:hypothetical protein GYMLUDRAFT_45732 [Collybiopsis luxurians FD-317 M1]|uniref:Uncharacterized protein n=1 Tax=Collybiopsis luxurians FD-317 M1 TaxID=944289 RepID=A0A0D0B3S7_9AGAR|nr:hypothetical protein GYMLUDRAFT_45732 [Collybiopsis luxurians FD-317 M1]
MPLFLEDKTGKLTGSEFVDIHDRLSLTYRRSTERNSSHTAYMIYNTSAHIPNSTYAQALIALDFGPGHALGTISFSSHRCIPMKNYLVRQSTHRQTYKFIGPDSQEYVWSWRSQANQEWTCTNSSGYLVAYYSLKIAGEPHYQGSSGCSLTIDESFGHLAPEFLASLMILRHISEYNL